MHPDNRLNTELSVEEGRLIAVRRAIEKFGNEVIISVLDASTVCEYISKIIDLDELEQLASPDQLEWYLDGVVMGLATSRLLVADVSVEELPKPKQQAARQFQTGVSPAGEVRVNS